MPGMLPPIFLADLKVQVCAKPLFQTKYAFYLCKKIGRSEHVLKRKLDALNSDYAMLQMQSEELRVRSVQGQMKMAV